MNLRPSGTRAFGHSEQRTYEGCRPFTDHVSPLITEVNVRGFDRRNRHEVVKSDAIAGATEARMPGQVPENFVVVVTDEWEAGTSEWALQVNDPEEARAYLSALHHLSAVSPLTPTVLTSLGFHPI